MKNENAALIYFIRIFVYFFLGMAFVVLPVASLAYVLGGNENIALQITRLNVMSLTSIVILALTPCAILLAIYDYLLNSNSTSNNNLDSQNNYLES